MNSMEVNSPNDSFMCKQHRLCISPMEPDEKLKLYNEWAHSFEEDYKKSGYAAWKVMSSMAVGTIIENYKHRTADNPVHILDLGCGTGCLAYQLKKRIDELKINIPIRLVGLDFCEAMLEKSRAKNCYDALVHGDVYKTLPDVARGMDIILACAMFAENHVNNNALPNVFGALNDGGFMFMTARLHTLTKQEREYMKQVKAGGMRVVARDVQPYFEKVDSEYWTLQKMPRS